MSDQQLSPSEHNPRYLHHTCHGTGILSLDEVGMFENKWNIGAFKNFAFQVILKMAFCDSSSGSQEHTL